MRFPQVEELCYGHIKNLYDECKICEVNDDNRNCPEYKQVGLYIFEKSCLIDRIITIKDKTKLQEKTK